MKQSDKPHAWAGQLVTLKQPQHGCGPLHLSPTVLSSRMAFKGSSVRWEMISICTIYAKLISMQMTCRHGIWFLGVLSCFQALRHVGLPGADQWGLARKQETPVTYDLLTSIWPYSHDLLLSKLLKCFPSTILSTQDIGTQPFDLSDFDFS